MSARDHRRVKDMHNCAARGCTRRILKRYVFCERCWKAVPTAQRRALYENYRNGQEADGRVSEAFVTAIRDAVEAVAEVVTISPAARCRSCEAAIVWVTTVAGNPAPLEAEPSADGNVWINEDGRAETVGPLEILVWDHAARPLRLSHFVTCPNAGDWRKTG